MVAPAARRPRSNLSTLTWLLLTALVWNCIPAQHGLLFATAISLSKACDTALGNRYQSKACNERTGGSRCGHGNRASAVRTRYAPAYATPAVPVSVSKFKCGEVVIGTPERRNEDGTVHVDIGAEAPLVVAGESLAFLSGDERRRFDDILNSFGQPKLEPEKSVDELISDTLIRARETPKRKRMTLMRPKLIYADDCKKERPGSQILSYDIGVGGEIKPRQLETPRVAGRKQPHCWFRDDQMEFIVTSVDPYENALTGEVWSPSVVETKRQAYMAMAIESVKPTASITQYTAVIKERHGDLLLLQLVDARLEGLNAYAYALPRDAVGDRVMVYLAAADPELQHVYFTRTSVSHEGLREETLKVLYDEMMYYYVKTGRWFRAHFEEDFGDSIQVRLAGKSDPESKYSAQVFLSQTPYFSPEGLLNDTFKRLNLPNDNFYYHDIMINVGKLNYGFNYDGCLFVRVHEYKMPAGTRSDRSGKTRKDVDCLELTTLNVCKPRGQLENAFKRLSEQSVEEMKDLKIYSSYPSLVLGQDDGYLYLAINYRRKAGFTLADDYFVGIMKIVPKSKTVPVGSFVNARVADISQNQVNMHYMETQSEIGGYDSFKYTAFTYWLGRVDGGKHVFGLSRFEEQKNLNLIWMDALCVPPPGSPQYNKFFAVQPLVTDSCLVHAVDDSLTPLNTEEAGDHFDAGQEPLAPASVTASFLRAARQRHEDHEQPHVPIDMKNFGRYTIEFDDDPDNAIAPPCYYIYNREIRLALIEEQLNGRALWKFKRTIELAKLRTEGEVKAFFYDARGRSFYQLLERLRDPVERRRVKPKEAFYFERSVKVLLSGIQDFYLEAIYDATDREELMFASLVPRSAKTGDFLQMEELAQYQTYLMGDCLMDREVCDALLRVLRILAHPNNSLMAHMRHRHRTIPDDVFYAYRKTLNYDSWVDYKMPEAELNAPDPAAGGRAPMPPVSELVREPEAVADHLLSQGLSQVKGLYSELLKMARTPVAEQMEKSLVHMNYTEEERADDYVEPEDVDTEVTEAFMDRRRRRRLEEGAPAAPRQNLRITSKEWRELNAVPRGFNREELKQYLRDIKAYRPVHGLRLPML
ncbi:tRNA 2-thiouridine(34) synthase MnmA [Babesia caballi]|uniref:tRNA 2-thiouridine(34) synthase MnmA n=1 Tax=Babesia caballi TaxID=5871 RepID=A0AAV4LN25_BABCB|nr:tRNA 2-thiouridine(34) synthase MnmA [Babesia caballi]